MKYFLMRKYFDDCTSIVDGMVGNTDSLAVVVKLLKNLIGNLFIMGLTQRRYCHCDRNGV